MMVGGGGALPYDAEVTYLESTGSEYINCGVKLCEIAGVTVTMEIDFAVSKGETTNNAVVLNSMKEVSPYPGFVFRKEGNTQNVSINGNIVFGTLGERLSLKYDYNVVSTHNVNATLFAGLNGNGSPWRYCKMKLYSCRLSIDNIVVRDFIPVRVGMTGYLYDKISGTLFGNAGSGNFRFGATKVNANDYALCDYIENQSTAYIDTDFFLKPNSRVVTNLEYISWSGWDVMFGSRDSTGSSNFNIQRNWNNSTINANYGGARSSSLSGTEIETLSIDFNGKSVSVNEASYIFGDSNFTSHYTCWIFGLNTGSPEHTHGTLWDFCIYDNGVMVRDYYPAYHRTLEKYGLFNSIDNTFYLSPNGVDFIGE